MESTSKVASILMNNPEASHRGINTDEGTQK
jgi:hypothetical protein